MPISQQQINTYIQTGSVLLDNMLPAELVDAAAQDMDALYANSEQQTGIKQFVREPSIVELIEHPAFEQACNQILGSEGAQLWACATLHTQPQAGAWSYQPESQHVDIQYTRSDWLAVPRRIAITFMVFLDDVTPERAPTLVRPGSHLQLAVERRDQLPENHKRFYADMPDVDFAEPQPVCGRKGQVAISTTALLHAPSRNVNDRARKVLFVVYASPDLSPRANLRRINERLAWLEHLEEQLDPDRRHLISQSLSQTRAAVTEIKHEAAVPG